MSSVHAYISTGRLQRNVARLQELAAPAHLMAVIKADAYGHGAIRIADLFTDCGISTFAVARISEAIELREHGIQGDILVLGAPLSDEWKAYQRYSLHATIPTVDHARELIHLKNVGQPICAHVKLDTGMHRLGMEADELHAAVQMLSDSPNARVAAIWTHLAEAGSYSPEGTSFTNKQLSRLRDAMALLSAPPPMIHVANSTAIIKQITNTLVDRPMLARAGLALFGLGETPELTDRGGLEPALKLIARITQIKTVKAGTPISYGGTWHAPEDSVIATVGAGYADGYPRLLSNRATVRINTRRYPVVGNICMDMFMVNLGRPGTVPPSIHRGDPVVLIGPGGPTAFDVASWAETIPYEICSRLGPRVPKRYVTEFENNVNI